MILVTRCTPHVLVWRCGLSPGTNRLFFFVLCCGSFLGRHEFESYPQAIRTCASLRIHIFKYIEYVPLCREWKSKIRMKRLCHVGYNDSGSGLVHAAGPDVRSRSDAAFRRKLCVCPFSHVAQISVDTRGNRAQWASNAFPPHSIRLLSEFGFCLLRRSKVKCGAAAMRAMVKSIIPQSIL